MPPAAMTKVMPKAMIPLYDTCRVMLTRFCGERKLALEIIATARNTASAIQTPPESRTLFQLTAVLFTLL